MLWEQLLSNPAIKAWALSCIVVALKTLVTGMVVSSIRIRKNVFASPEDYEMQKLEPQTATDEEVERARRAHLNDLEAGLPFVLVGFVYALTQPSTLGLWICFAGFPIGRILHLVLYMKGLMPHRTAAWAIGFVITLWMAVASALSILF
ncbi:MAG: MAPEG family protein [bacterium]|nr:MAPEG family protein [bacterium]MCP5069436.1 MAPEG family protein [bacterium]